jgi:enoyl-CoA hydratase/carnithine racemase
MAGSVPTLPDTLAVELRGPLALLRLNRPAKHNALDEATVLRLERFFTALPDSVRAIVLHGAGEHFCAGLDLSEAQAQDATAAFFCSRLWHRAFARIAQGDVPVVAALHGAVVGGGLELACCAHIRVAESSAYYALPEGQRGIFVGGGGAVRVPQLIGVARMTDMMLTGRTYGATEGVAAGFSQYLVEPGQGLAKAIELATRISNNAKLTNYAVLHALPRIAAAPAETGLLTESLMAAIAVADGEAKRRLADFLEKRAGKIAHTG